MLWMQRSDGQPSASVTFASIAFGIVSLWLLLSIFGHIGPLTIKPFDSGSAMAFLMPVLTLYFGRRLTDTHYASQPQSNTSPGSGEPTSQPSQTSNEPTQPEAQAANGS